MNYSILIYLIFFVVDIFGFILGGELLRQWFNRVPTRPILKNLSYCGYIMSKTVWHSGLLWVVFGV